MRFNPGEIWTTTEGAPLRAVVIAIDDDGRRGTLWFESTGEERSFLWMELTHAGKWRVDTSPRPVRRASDLGAMVMDEAMRHPVCPEGMGVQIRGTGGDKWMVDCVPPPGSAILYADCCDHINRVAKKYRFLYGLAPDA
jgi:hypothetical protein